MREFLGNARYCRLQIPTFAGIAKPLDQSLGRNGLLSLEEKEKEAFLKLKEALTSALALGLPDITMHFHLFVDEWHGVANSK